MTEKCSVFDNDVVARISARGDGSRRTFANLDPVGPAQFSPADDFRFAFREYENFESQYQSKRLTLKFLINFY